MRGWVLSIAVHIVLLPVAVFVASDRTVTAEIPDFRCRFRGPEPTLNRLARIEDSCAWTGGNVEAHFPQPIPLDAEVYGSLSNPGWYVLIIEEGGSVCHTFMCEIWREYQGRVVIVHRSQYRQILHPPKSFADRLESLANNRSGRTRLKRS